MAKKKLAMPTASFTWVDRPNPTDAKPNLVQRQTVRILCACLVVAICCRVEAADVRGTDDSIYVVPAEKGYRIDSKGDRVYPMKRRAVLTPGEEVTIFIEGANPLIFQYDGTKLTPVNTDNFTAALKFGEVMNKLLKQNKAAEGEKLEVTGDITITLAGVDVDALDSSIRKLNTYIRDVPAIIDNTIEKDSVDAAKSKVKAWNDLDSIKSAITKAQAQLAAVASLAPIDKIDVIYQRGNTLTKTQVPVGCVIRGQFNFENLDDIFRYISQIESRRAAHERASASRIDLLGQAVAVGESKEMEKADQAEIRALVLSLSTNTSPSTSTIESACDKVNAKVPKYSAKPDAIRLLGAVCASIRAWGDAAVSVAAVTRASPLDVGEKDLVCPDVEALFDINKEEGTLWKDSVSIFNILYARRNDLDKLIAAADSLVLFKKLVASVGSRKELVRVAYDAKHIQPVKITVTPNEAFSTYFTDETQKAQAKGLFEGTMEFEPKEFFHLKVSPAAVYSFVDVSKHSAVKNGEGKLVIKVTETDYAALNVAAMMNIYPDKYYGTGIVPFTQIGLTPNPDEWAFFLGGGLEFYEDMTIAAGVVYQQVEELVDGLSVGMEVADQASIKTKDEFKAGLYIQFGLTF